MARIYVINQTARGHIVPTLPILRSLIATGHELIVYTGAEFRALIEPTGATYRAYDPPLPPVVPAPNLFAFAKQLVDTTAQVLPGLLQAAASDQPDLIIHDSIAPWGRALATLTRTPAVNSTTTFALSPAVVGTTPRFALRLAHMLFTGLPHIAAYERQLAALRRRYRLPYWWFNDLISNPAQLNLVYTSRQFQPASSFFGRRWLFVGPTLANQTLSQPLPFSRDNRRLVYAALGTIFHNNPTFFRSCCAALADLDVQVLLAVGPDLDLATLGDIPNNVIIQRFVPQVAVLQSTDLFITHAGMNSVHEALWSNVPVLAVPQMVDQFVVAERVAALGCGQMLTNAQLTPSSLRAAVVRLLNQPTYRQRATAIGATLRAAGGTQVAVAAIEQVLAESCPPPQL
jgi:MGT family glycosyltransferase